MAVQGDKRVVLVTGASSGIGKAIAARLAQGGWLVFGASRSGAPLGVAGVEMIAINVDEDAAVADGVAGLLARTGRIDAVVNNAGWSITGAIEDTSVAEARAQMETNFFGVLRVCRAVLPGMRARGSGAIINISSLSGLFGTPFCGLYSASKFAVEGMTEALRFETRRLGIRVVLIEPGDHASALAARRLTVAGAAVNPAYRAAFERSKAAQDKDEAAAPPAENVAVLVARVLELRNPAPRYAVGMAMQRIVVPLKRFLPGRWFEAIIAMAVGV